MTRASRPTADSRIAERPVGLASAFSTILLAETIQAVLPTGPRRVIDVGGGEAPYARWAAGQVHVAVDWRCPELTLASHQVIGDACALPVGSGIADLVLCTEVVEHVFDEHALYHELRRIVRLDGCLVLSAPFVHSLHESPHDYRRPTSAGLVHGLTRAGFEVQAVFAVGSTGDVVRDLAFRSAVTWVAAVCRRVPKPIGTRIKSIFTALQVRCADRSLKRYGPRPAPIDPFVARPRLTLGYVVLAKPI